jgi:hypothetical protein
MTNVSGLIVQIENFDAGVEDVEPAGTHYR